MTKFYSLPSCLLLVAVVASGCAAYKRGIPTGKPMAIQAVGDRCPANEPNRKGILVFWNTNHCGEVFNAPPGQLLTTFIYATAGLSGRRSFSDCAIGVVTLKDGSQVTITTNKDGTIDEKGILAESIDTVRLQGKPSSQNHPLSYYVYIGHSESSVPEKLIWRQGLRLKNITDTVAKYTKNSGKLSAAILRRNGNGAWRYLELESSETRLDQTHVYPYDAIIFQTANNHTQCPPIVIFGETPKTLANRCSIRKTMVLLEPLPSGKAARHAICGGADNGSLTRAERPFSGCKWDDVLFVFFPPAVVTRQNPSGPSGGVTGGPDQPKQPAL